MTQELKEKLFNKLVKVYIKKAKPVGSKILKRKYFKHLADSTIRMYLYDLVNEKLLENVRFSVGRIPTDLGWRFFIEKNLDRENYDFNDDNIIKDSKDEIDVLERISEKFKCYCILENKKVEYEIGLENLLENPELKNLNILKEFAKILKNIKENIKIFSNIENDVTTFIGKEIPFGKYKNFSIIIKNFKPNKKILIVSVKRFNYPRVINLLKTI